MTVKVRRGIMTPEFTNRASSVQGRAAGAGPDPPPSKRRGLVTEGGPVRELHSPDHRYWFRDGVRLARPVGNQS